jgi:hypothetical protein
MIKTRIYFAGHWYVDVLQERENPTVGEHIGLLQKLNGLAQKKRPSCLLAATNEKLLHQDYKKNFL